MAAQETEKFTREHSGCTAVGLRLMRSEKPHKLPNVRLSTLSPFEPTHAAITAERSCVTISLVETPG